MFNNTCTTDGCGGNQVMLSSHCLLHDTLAKARHLQSDEFDQLREALATTAPLTEDERNRRQARLALSDIEWKARDLKRAKKRARAGGATDGQIADAVRRGKAQVS